MRCSPERSDSPDSATQCLRGGGGSRAWQCVRISAWEISWVLKHSCGEIMARQAHPAET